MAAMRKMDTLNDWEPWHLSPNGVQAYRGSRSDHPLEDFICWKGVEA